MITILSGLPGNGKTLKAVQMLQQRKAAGQFALHKGITGLDPSVAREWEKDPSEWQELPPGTLLVIDEAQDFAKTNGKGGSPEWITNLSKHRHAGVDFVFITQDPRFLDPWVRRLANQHIHLVRKFGAEASVTHEWDRCEENPVDYHALQRSVTGLFRFPKELYQVYKSATLHLVKRRVPWKVWAFFGLFPLAGFLLWLGLHGFSASHEKKPEPLVAAKGEKSGASAPPGGEHVLTGDEYVRRFTPVVGALPWSAPAFQKMQPSDYPVAYCMAFETARGEDCRCITQQGTRYDMKKDSCITIAQNGVFDPFHSQRKDLRESEQKERRQEQREDAERRAGEQAQRSPVASFSLDDHVQNRVSAVALPAFRAGPTSNASGPIPSTVGVQPVSQLPPAGRIGPQLH